MLITPRPGAERTTVLQHLEAVDTALKNVRGQAATAGDLTNAYLRWTADAVRLLRHDLRENELEALVLTRRYWTIQSMADAAPLARDLVDVEIDDRLLAFEESVRTTRTEFDRWMGVHRLVVADTSFYHQHPQKLDEVDLRQILQSGRAPIGLVVPMVVIDEGTAARIGDN